MAAFWLFWLDPKEVFSGPTAIESLLHWGFSHVLDIMGLALLQVQK